MNFSNKSNRVIVFIWLGACFMNGCQVPDTLPEILVDRDGTPIKTVKQWEEERRGEILELFREYVYGRVPDANPEIVFETNLIAGHEFTGKADMKEVTMHFIRQADTCTATMLIWLPAESPSSAPVFLGMNFYGNHTIHPDTNISLTESFVNNRPEFFITENRASEASRGVRAYRWPVDLILEHGYGLATIYYGDLDPDFDDGFLNGIHGLLDSGPRDSSSWGSISAWAWGLSRAMDYFETDPGIDPKKVVVIGHSRLGKTALWAGAQDERFAMVISNESGCGGAARSRRKHGERLSDINRNFPHWFAGKFHAYNGREEDLPVDQHMLIALIAPRPVYVASAENDDWADPTGEYLSMYHAGEVYALYGYRTLKDRRLPDVDKPVMLDRMAYHIRSGDHDLLRYDWEMYLDYADRYFEEYE
jgi:hypothetical protein